MTQTKVIAPNPAVQSTCADCPFFQDYQDRGRGLCTAFDRVVRQHHQLTSDCEHAIESEQLLELLNTHNAFLRPTINGFPGRDVYKQLPELSYERIGYVSENLAGWFANDRHGLLVAERYKSQSGALKALLNSCKPVESKDDQSPFKRTSEVNFNTDQLPEEDTPHSEFEPGRSS